MNKKEILSYETDASRLIGNAEKIVFPKKAEDVQNVVKTSNIDIVPRGGGTSQAGGTIPIWGTTTEANEGHADFQPGP